MLRPTATRSMLRSLVNTPATRSSYSAASASFRNAKANVNSLSQLSKSRPQVLANSNRPATLSLLYATKSDGPPFDERDAKEEEAWAKEKLTVDAQHVSEGSSVRHVFEKGQAEVDKSLAHGGLRSDLETIKETFSMSEVPRDTLFLGAAGLLPYAATSLSTVYLAYDIGQARQHGDGYLFSPELAHQLLDIITPVQIGYGAVIISFLGAIHWGMEYAAYGGKHSYRRYMYGVIAPAVAWPTIFMPVEYALITQFFAFNFLYFADARAAARGWFPAWYSIYRFVLTFVVGASIVISLIGRGRIVKHDGHIKQPADYIKGDRDQQWIALEREEKERHQALAKDEDDEEEEEEEEEGTEDSDDSEDSDEKGENADDTGAKDEKKDDKKPESKEDNKADTKPEPKDDPTDKTGHKEDDKAGQGNRSAIRRGGTGTASTPANNVG